MEPSPRGVSESSESVRSKLRESLAAALALASPPNHDKLAVSSDIQHDQHVEVPNEVPLKTEVVLSTSATLVSEGTSLERPAEVSNFEVQALNHKLDEEKTLLQEKGITEFPSPLKISDIDGQEFRMVPVPCNGSMSTIFRSETDMGDAKANYPSGESGMPLLNAEADIGRNSKRPKLEHDGITGDIARPVVQCPHTLAITIEAELFKVFGGVNKKYKEKARSLLFNLKDRNNPDLRERVMSGEIAPDRLCCMTVEDLASKELSDWRIAKAEELAQMVVLPDSEVDIRLLVRKTHKGEFQIEVERDDSISVEVGIGETVFSQVPQSTKSTEKAELVKSNGIEKPEGTIRTEKTDLKDDPNNRSTKKHTDFIEFTVEELRNTESLPPIVSLDEFMGSLESEPFETLQLHPEERIRNPDGKKSSDNLGPQSKELDNQFTNVGHSALGRPESNDIKLKVKDTFEPGDGPKMLAGEHPLGVPQSDQVWEGFIQLNVSATANVSACFKSGEKTTTEDWPSFLEIKGRVRVDAFVKFLQELPHSRSRAIMVALFCWKEGSSENGLLKLREVSESYVEDERVGFAEPAPGVELYLCPPHSKTTELLGRHVPSEYLDPLKDIADGLIGIVVWRKTNVTIVSPKSTSHSLQRQSSKKHSTTRKQDRETVGLRPPANDQNLFPANAAPSAIDDNEIDDIPPGFGPAAAASRDADDLPEFDFSSRSRAAAGPAVTSAVARVGPPQLCLPAEQMGGPIHNFGLGGGRSTNFSVTPSSSNLRPVSGFSVEVQPWNDDDDIPEWHPRTNSGLQFNPSQLMQGHQLHQQQDRLQMPLPSTPPLLAPLPFRTPPSHLLLPQMAGTIQGQQVRSPWQAGEVRAPSYGTYNTVQGTVPATVPPCSYSGLSVGSTFDARLNFSTGQNGVHWRP